MKNKKLLLTLVFQILIVGALASLIYGYVQSQIKPTVVYQYKSLTKMNTVIDETTFKENFETKIISARDFTPNMVTKPDEIMGMAINYTAYPNQTVYKEFFIPAQNMDIFKTMDTSSYRKVAVAVDYSTSFGGNLKPGEKVDLLYVGKGSKQDTDGRESTFVYSKVFMSDIYVYKVLTGNGYRYNDHSHLAEGEAPNQQDVVYLDGSNLYSGDVGLVVLLLTPEQSEEFAVRANSGKIQILGRFEDSETPQTVGFVAGEYEKLFLGYGNAETARTLVGEDTYKPVEDTNKPIQ